MSADNPGTQSGSTWKPWEFTLRTRRHDKTSKARIATVSSTMKVKIKRVNAVAIWKWNVPNDDVCGICRVPFDGCCPDCQIPGDDCPILTGQCKHVFHMYVRWLLLVDGRHCIEKWLNTDTKEQCPMDRQPWGSPLLGSFVDLVTSKSK